MKALVLEEPKVIHLKQVPDIKVPNGWVLVSPTAVSICGSDYHSFRGESALISYPRILGHEVCGVVKASDTSQFTIGDKVILMPYLSCGNCIACRKGKSNCCSNLSVYGVHRDGALAEYFAAPPSQLIKVDAKTDPRMAALVEPLSISTHAVVRSGAGKGDVVMVSGAGPIGLGAALMSRLEGARVIIADPSAARRAFVAGNYGFGEVYDPLVASFDETLKDLTDGEGPDIIIDSTGSSLSMASNVHRLSNGGRMVWVGISQRPIAIDGTDFHKRETELFDSRAAFRSDFEKVLNAIQAGLLDPLPMITHSASFKESEEAFREWEGLHEQVFKAIVLMDEN